MSGSTTSKKGRKDGAVAALAPHLHLYPIEPLPLPYQSKHDDGHEHQEVAASKIAEDEHLVRVVAP